MFRGGKTPTCGGTLLSTAHVLTAAHCTEGKAASDIRVLLGEHVISDNSVTMVEVARIIQDPNYANVPPANSDFSILQLTRSVSFTASVGPACLPADPGHDFAGSLATVTGWGTLSSGGGQASTLQEVQVTVTWRSR